MGLKPVGTRADQGGQPAVRPALGLFLVRAEDTSIARANIFVAFASPFLYPQLAATSSCKAVSAL